MVADNYLLLLTETDHGKFPEWYTVPQKARILRCHVLRNGPTFIRASNLGSLKDGVLLAIQAKAGLLPTTAAHNRHYRPNTIASYDEMPVITKVSQ